MRASALLRENERLATLRLNVPKLREFRFENIAGLADFAIGEKQCGGLAVPAIELPRMRGLGFGDRECYLLTGQYISARASELSALL